MMKLTPKLNNNQLENYLLKLIDKIADKYKLQLSTQDKKNLVGYIAKVMLEKGEFFREKVIDTNKEFMHKLTLAVVAASKMTNVEKLLEEIKKIFDKKGMTLEDLLDQKKLEKKLLRTEMRPLELLQEKIKEALLKMDELKLIKLPRPAPGSPPEAKEDDINMIILGLTNPKIQGSHAKVVSFFVGNLYGIPDVNPYNGIAPLDQQNKIATEQGDPNGVHEAAKQHYQAFLGDIVNEVIREANTPTPPGPTKE